MAATSLKNIPNKTFSLGYILFQDGKRVHTCGVASLEFLFEEENIRHTAFLAVKSQPGFHVYYKDDGKFKGVTKHFDTLADAIPYLQTHNRVLIEYRFSNLAQPKK